MKILQKQEFLVEQKSVEIVCEVWQIFVNVNMITSAYKSEYSCPLGRVLVRKHGAAAENSSQLH